MSAFDVEKMLAAVAGEDPCGEDLAYDAAYAELERISQGTPEQQMGDSVIEAQEPNWKDVKRLSQELLGRSKDLRLCLYLSLSSIRVDGLDGLRDGAALLRGLTERYWDGFYPKLDPDDNNDPLERMNIISALAAPMESFGDPMMFLKRISEIPLTNSRQIGRFSLRQLRMATGELARPANASTPGPDSALIDAAVEDTSTEDLQAAAAAAREAEEHFQALDGLLTERVGAAKAANLEALHKTVSDVSRTLSGWLARRGYGSAEEAAGASSNGAAGAPGAAGGGGGGAALSGEIRSAQDVLLAFDKICRYYESSEVSSPVPLLVKGARRLVSKSFVEINRVLTPEAVRLMEQISGTAEGESS
jgi:type VI secretion system protein ImpA